MGKKENRWMEKAKLALIESKKLREESERLESEIIKIFWSF